MSDPSEAQDVVPPLPTGSADSTFAPAPEARSSRLSTTAKGAPPSTSSTAARVLPMRLEPRRSVQSVASASFRSETVAPPPSLAYLYTGAAMGRLQEPSAASQGGSYAGPPPASAQSARP